MKYLQQISFLKSGWKSHWVMGRYCTRCFLIIGFALLLLSINLLHPTQASLTEDFSQGLEDWEVWGENWTPAETGGTVEAVDPKIVIEAGQLVSKGEREDSTWNIACKTNENGIYGNWSLEVYTPKVFQAVSLLFMNDRSKDDVVERTETDLNDTGIIAKMYAHYFGYELLEYRDGEKQITQDIYQYIDPKINVGWHILRFERNATHASLFFDEQMMLSSILTEKQLPSFEFFCLQLGMGDQTRIDNIFITSQDEHHPDHFLKSNAVSDTTTTTEESNLNIFMLLAGLSIGLTVSGVGGYVTYRYYRWREFEKFTANGNTTPEVKETVKSLFESNLKNHHFLIASIIRNKRGFLQESITDNFKTYKFLLHPLRLSAMKIIYDNHKITSIELRDQLGLSWSEVSVTLKKLEKKGYIMLKDEFHESSIKQTIYLKYYGKKEFRSFLRLLDDFLELAENFDDLYPDN